MRRSLLILLLLSGCAAFFCGCAGAVGGTLRSDLANHGPVALDSKNPYLAANLFIAQESAESPVLKGFLKHRGAPEAIELRKKFLEPYRVYFFYPRENEAYRADEGREDWLIKGPETIPASIRDSLDKLRLGKGGAALLVEKSPAKKEDENKEDLAKMKELVYQETPPPVPTTAREKAQALPPAQQDFRTRIKRDGPIKPLRTEEEIRPRKPAEELPIVEEPVAPPAEDTPERFTGVATETPSGDIIHRVSYPGETLRIISTWYTGDVTNAGRIARINAIKDANQLNLGQNVRIPRYLLVRTDALPMDEVEERLKALRSR